MNPIKAEPVDDHRQSKLRSMFRTVSTEMPPTSGRQGQDASAPYLHPPLSSPGLAGGRSSIVTPPGNTWLHSQPPQQHRWQPPPPPQQQHGGVVSPHTPENVGGLPGRGPWPLPGPALTTLLSGQTGLATSGAARSSPPAAGGCQSEVHTHVSSYSTQKVQAWQQQMQLQAWQQQQQQQQQRDGGLKTTHLPIMSLDLRSLGAQGNAAATPPALRPPTPHQQGSYMPLPPPAFARGTAVSGAIQSAMHPGLHNQEGSSAAASSGGGDGNPGSHSSMWPPNSSRNQPPSPGVSRQRPVQPLLLPEEALPAQYSSFDAPRTTAGAVSPFRSGAVTGPGYMVNPFQPGMGAPLTMIPTSRVGMNPTRLGTSHSTAALGGAAGTKPGRSSASPTRGRRTAASKVDWSSLGQPRPKRGKSTAAAAAAGDDDDDDDVLQEELEEEEVEEEEEEEEAYSSDDSTAHVAKRRKQKKVGVAGDAAYQVTVKDGRPATSGYKGVTRHRHTGKWEAHLWDSEAPRKTGTTGGRTRGRQVYLGGYATEEDAAHAYDKAALAYWGDTATLNFPRPTYEGAMEEFEGLSREEVVARLRRSSTGFSRGCSRYRGVTRHHQQGKWEARIGRICGNKYKYLGAFDTEEEAAKAFDEAAVQYRGQKAVTNFPIHNYMREGQAIAAAAARSTSGGSPVGSASGAVAGGSNHGAAAASAGVAEAAAGGHTSPRRRQGGSSGRAAATTPRSPFASSAGTALTQHTAEAESAAAAASTSDSGGPGGAFLRLSNGDSQEMLMALGAPPGVRRPPARGGRTAGHSQVPPLFAEFPAAPSSVTSAPTAGAAGASGATGRPRRAAAAAAGGRNRYLQEEEGELQDVDRQEEVLPRRTSLYPHNPTLTTERLRSAWSDPIGSLAELPLNNLPGHPLSDKELRPEELLADDWQVPGASLLTMTMGRLSSAGVGPGLMSRSVSDSMQMDIMQQLTGLQSTELVGLDSILYGSSGGPTQQAGD